jgi:hypothetical protein
MVAQGGRFKMKSQNHFGIIKAQGYGTTQSVSLSIPPDQRNQMIAETAYYEGNAPARLYQSANGEPSNPASQYRGHSQYQWSRTTLFIEQ